MSVAGSAHVQEHDPLLLLLNKTDIWVNEILPYLGPGHFIFVVGVSHRFKELYRDYFRSIKDVPYLWTRKWTGRIPYAGRIPATVSCTFYNVTFSSLSTSKYWLKRVENGEAELYQHVCTTAAKLGNLRVLRWAHESGLVWDEKTCSSAAKCGQLQTLMYAHQNGCPWDSVTFHWASRMGRIDILDYAYSKDCPWDKWVCFNAAAGGHLEVLIWLHEKGCPWDETTCDVAAANGHLALLQYAHTHGCPWDDDIEETAAQRGHFEVVQYVRDHMDVGVAS